MQDEVCPWCTLTWQTSLSSKCKFPGTPGIWLIVSTANNKKKASKWKGCILQFRHLTKRIDLKDLKKMSVVGLKSLYPRQIIWCILKHWKQSASLTARAQISSCEHAKCKHWSLFENENLKQTWEKGGNLRDSADILAGLWRGRGFAVQRGKCCCELLKNALLVSADAAEKLCLLWELQFSCTD